MNFLFKYLKLGHLKLTIFFTTYCQIWSKLQSYESPDFCNKLHLHSSFSPALLFLCCLQVSKMRQIKYLSLSNYTTNNEIQKKEAGALLL